MKERVAIDFGLGFGFPRYVCCKVDILVDRGPDFLERLAKAQFLSSTQEMFALARAQVRQLEILPIIPIQSFDNEDPPDAPPLGDIASMFILSRCTETLYLRRRAPQYDYDHLSRKIYFFRDDIGMLKNRT